MGVGQAKDGDYREVGGGGVKARIPADVDMADRIFAGLSLKQLAIIALHGLAIWLLYQTVGSRFHAAVFMALAIPIGVAGFLLATASHNGTPLDKVLISAAKFLRTPKKRFLATEVASASSRKRRLDPIALPLESITDSGRLDLGPHGSAVICRASSVNLDLRAESEKQALADGFGRLLNSLDGSIQFLICAGRLDLDRMIERLESDASGLPHRLLEDAARDHAAFLKSLAQRGDLFRREAFVCVRHRGTNPEEAGIGLAHRVDDSRSLLRAVGVRIDPLSPSLAAALIEKACDPNAQTSSRNRGLPWETVGGSS